MRRTYVTEARVAELAARLSPTEQAVLETLQRVRVASGAQLTRLHFPPNGTEETAARRSRRTLTRLVELRILARLERQVGGARAGSAGFIYGLDVAGQKLAAACGPAGGSRVRKPWTPGASFLAHALEVTELYVRLREAEQAGQLELTSFDAEPDCWRTFVGIGGGRVTLKPDAFIRIAVNEYEHLSFVEVDRATHSAPALGRKLTVYRRYWATGREEERFGIFPRVVVLVPSKARRDVAIEVCGTQPADSWPLFRVALSTAAIPALAGEGS